MHLLQPPWLSAPALPGAAIEAQLRHSVSKSAASDAPGADGGNLAGFDPVAEDVLGAVQDTEDLADPIAAKYMDDLQSLERLVELYDLRPTLRAYAHVRLFTLQYRITWLIHGGPR